MPEYRVNKKQSSKKRMVITIIFALLCASVGSAGTYMLLEGRKEKVVKPTTPIEGEVIVENIAYDKVREISKHFGYEDVQDFDYTEDDTYEFFKHQDDDIWLETTGKKFGKYLFGKEYNIHLFGYFMLGYDLKNIEKEDLYFDEKSKILHIKVPALELAYIPMFDKSYFDSFVGVFRKEYTEEYRKLIYEDAINQGIQAILDDKSKVREGYKLTNDSFKETLFDKPELKKHVKDIVFEKSNQESTIRVEETREAVLGE
ncbi:hypothetical protein [Cytobacillus firmus]|uniref:hypothetical protein n=1 Tax=Cytobacillus firmus TaxID=1399 RepID=UPI00064FE47C|nr:hypothetical protein [Cytobacillus firmus]KML40624.1 hypothetical protein VL14_13270 [Cytobacillus firmus]